MKIEVKQVVKQYEGFSLNCSLTVREGMVTGLIGKNGAGKSTTFKAILGLIYPDSGVVTVDGQDVRKLTPRQKEKIGVVLSDATFCEELTVKQIIHIMKNMYRSFVPEEFENMCDRFQIPLKKPIKEFSTGMRAKLKVLLAMSHGAKFLILDEPTAGLDVVARNEILDLLRSYMETEGHSILISSHISGDLEGLCDELYMVDEGKIVFQEETPVLLDEYGVLKVTEAGYESMDKTHILARKKESFGYSILTNQKQFYEENYPDLIVEKASVDQVITIIIGREENVA